MIVATEGEQLLVITQNDHAHFAGELLALWRSNGLPQHPRRRELLFAAREHDNGWAEIDSAPMSHAESGRPLDFRAVPRDTRWDIWRRGTRRYFEREPYAALLIVRHAVHLHRSQRLDPDWLDLFAEWHELEAELMEMTHINEKAVACDYRWIELTDLLSLAVCNRWTHDHGAHGFRATLSIDDDVVTDGIVAAGTLSLHPFPLAGVTTFRIACRMIPDRAYTGDVDLGVELATARWRQYVVRVAPGV